MASAEQLSWTERAKASVQGFLGDVSEDTPLGKSRIDIVQHLHNAGVDLDFDQFHFGTKVSELLEYIHSSEE